MERTLSLFAVVLLGGCFAAGWTALRGFAAGDDLRGLLYAGITFASGLAAQRMLGDGRENE